MPHIHGGLAHAFSVFLIVATVGIFWRIGTMLLAPHDGILGALGKAMSIAY